MAYGPEALTDQELIAIWIGSGSKYQSVTEISYNLLERFVDLRGIRKATHKQLCGVCGVGSSKYILLRAVMELHQRSLQQSMQRLPVFTHVDDVKMYVKMQFTDLESEVFGALILDSQHRLITMKKLFFGTINAAAVYPRELVKQVLLSNGAAVILVHNHPSGHAQPSRADIELTVELKQAMQLIDVDLLDHLVVGDGEIISFAQKGLL